MQTQSTSEEGWEPADTETQAHLTTLTEIQTEVYHQCLTGSISPHKIGDTMNVWPWPPWGAEMTSWAACLSPAVPDSIDDAIHIADTFRRPPLTAILACYGRLVLLMLPFTRTAETGVLTEHFCRAIIDSTGVQKAKGCSQFFCGLAKRRGSCRAQSSLPLIRHAASPKHTPWPGSPWMLNTSAKPISSLAPCHKSISSL